MNASAYHRKGIQFAGKERFGDAARQFRAALKLDGDDARCWNDLGLVLWQGGEWREAIRCLERAARLAPEDGDIGEHLLTLYVVAEQRRRALKQAERLMEQRPDAEGILGVVGGLRRLEGDLARCVWKRLKIIWPGEKVTRSPEFWSNTSPTLSYRGEGTRSTVSASC